MKPILLTLAVLSLLPNAFSQRIRFDWETTPVVHPLCNPDYAKESACVMNEKVQLEYSVNAKGILILTRRIHSIVKVIDEKGIEMYNKMKINYSKEYPITMIKARTILPSGKVIELKPDAFKDMNDEDGSVNKLFAMEGIEKGAEIEYMAEMTQSISFFGTHYIQDQIPTCHSEIEVVTPENLIFEMKGYNNAKVARDTLLNEKNSFLATADNLPGLEEEKLASYLSHFARVEYALAYNTETKGRGIRILTWDDAAKNIYKIYFAASEKDLKPVTKMLEGNKDYMNCKSNADKIVWIENFIKTNYVVQEYVPDEHAEELDFILKNKLTNETGYKLLLAACYQSQHIPFEIGFTTNRLNKPFDYSFTNWDNLKNCVFYFPDTKQYMAPTEIGYRIPFIPANWCGNYGLFCKILKLGEVVSASAEKRKIPEMPAESSYHNHDIEVTFNQEIDTANVQIKNILAGYNAIDLMPVFVFLEKDKRDDATKQILQLSDKVETIDNFKYENNSFSSVTAGKPLIISATIHAAGIIEKAGNKYLFHVGELIGRQSELYQEKERQFDIEIPNPHQYTRTLKIHIPQGYKVNNTEKLNMSVIDNLNGVENCKFISTYTLNGNDLTVNVFEIYHNSMTPKSNYEDYKKVINAAADFNKIVIVFERNN